MSEALSSIHVTNHSSAESRAGVSQNTSESGDAKAPGGPYFGGSDVSSRRNTPALTIRARTRTANKGKPAAAAISAQTHAAMIAILTFSSIPGGIFTTLTPCGSEELWFHLSFAEGVDAPGVEPIKHKQEDENDQPQIG